ncbi:hypothetical protein [Gelidibacter salicanalis]|uniref:DUF4179 domain-containing protein n=1 Tax=Gelidibacter salicanalis TaxID=291193 RepID=A0A934KNK9_9FLAO|nr:hypothetical protein [Gelidibacter salicanalis]MBJ7879275.1 hypothetical protein [Gelidibacter salicanalis]
MPKNVRELFENDQNKDVKRMPAGHEARFLRKLEQELPIEKRGAMPNAHNKGFRFMQIAASIVVLLGLTFGAFQFFQKPEAVNDTPNTTVAIKSLGDVSPGLKKVEDYYMANINLELANVKLTPENKALFDSYIVRLEELNKEYLRLSEELTEMGPSEPTVNALIDNLKLRLNLLYRFKDQLKELKTYPDEANIT